MQEYGAQGVRAQSLQYFLVLVSLSQMIEVRRSDRKHALIT